MQNSEVSCVRYLIGRIVKTYDYVNRVVLTLPLSVYEGTWTHSPLSLLCITMILRVHRKFFEITTFPNSDMIFDRDDRIDEVMNYEHDAYNVDLEITKTTGEVYLYKQTSGDHHMF